MALKYCSVVRLSFRESGVEAEGAGVAEAAVLHGEDSPDLKGRRIAEAQKRAKGQAMMNAFAKVRIL